MSERIPKVVVIGGTYVDMAFRCGQIPAPGQAVSGSALSCAIAGPGPSKPFRPPCAAAKCTWSARSAATGSPRWPSRASTSTRWTPSTCSSPSPRARASSSRWSTARARTPVVTTSGPIAPAAGGHRDGGGVHRRGGRVPDPRVPAAGGDCGGVRCAELHGTPVILNPARPLEHAGQQHVDLPSEYFSANVLIPNLGEAAEITDTLATDIRMAKSIGSDLVAAAPLRGHHDGSARMRGGGSRRRRPRACFRVDLVDKTGSGDAFAGAWPPTARSSTTCARPSSSPPPPAPWSARSSASSRPCPPKPRSSKCSNERTSTCSPAATDRTVAQATRLASARKTGKTSKMGSAQRGGALYHGRVRLGRVAGRGQMGNVRFGDGIGWG